MEIVPRQRVVVQQVNHNVDDRLDVVSPTFGISSATIQTGKHEVS